MTEPTVHKAVQRVVGRCKTMRDVSTISLSSRRPNRPQGTVGSDGISRYRAECRFSGVHEGAICAEDRWNRVPTPYRGSARFFICFQHIHIERQRHEKRITKDLCPV